MKIFEGTMILTDLDGTYLADDHHISAENRAAAEWFMENGGRFSIATGRSKAGMEHFFPELRINAPAILYNGSVIYDFEKQADVLDLCCGSGAIGISLAKLAGGAKVTCSDISEDAIKTAQQNAQINGCKSVKFEKSDMFDAFCRKMGNKKFNLIISNPPYIATEVIGGLEPEVRDHEPAMALDGGEDGLKFYRIIAEQAPEHLKKGGVLMLEIGFDQKDAVKDLLRETGRFEKIVGLTDLTGKDRIIAAILSKNKQKTA